MLFEGTITVKSEGELVEKMRRVKLKNGTKKPYLNSFISIETFNPEQLNPVQRYVHKDELRKIEQLRWAIEYDYGYDILRLGGYLTSEYEDGTVIDILPIVVEERFNHRNELELLIADGQHRAFLAYQMGMPINTVFVRGVRTPYYAYALPNKWADVELVNEIPEGYIKKFHVVKEHRRLYRDYNTSFNNIGTHRPYSK